MGLGQLNQFLQLNHDLHYTWGIYLLGENEYTDINLEASEIN